MTEHRLIDCYYDGRIEEYRSRWLCTAKLPGWCGYPGRPCHFQHVATISSQAYNEYLDRMASQAYSDALARVRRSGYP